MKKKCIYIVMLVIAIMIALSVKSHAATSATLSSGTITITQNLTNAPYDNNEYCNEKLYKNFIIELESSPEGSTCSGYPQSLSMGSFSGSLTGTTYTKTATLDFSGTTFDKLGDYVFDIYPQGNSNGRYEATVQVRNNEGTIEAELMSQVLKPSEGTKSADITYTQENKNSYIEITKKVKGDIANVSKKFTFNVKIDGYNNNTYTVTAPTGNPTSHTVTRTGSEITGVEYSIAHNETITIGKDGSLLQIPVGTKYTITETAEQGYTTTYEYQNRTGSREVSSSTVSDEVDEIDNNNKLTFYNTKNAEPATGIVYNVLPFAVILVVAGVGIYLMKKTKGKK